MNHSQNLNKRDELTLFITKGNSQHTKHFISKWFFIFFFSSVPFVLAESSIWELYLFTKVIFKFVKIATSWQLYSQQYCHIKNITFVDCLFIICFYSVHLQDFLFAQVLQPKLFIFFFLYDFIWMMTMIGHF